MALSFADLELYVYFSSTILIFTLIIVLILICKSQKRKKNNSCISAIIISFFSTIIICHILRILYSTLNINHTIYHKTHSILYLSTTFKYISFMIYDLYLRYTLYFTFRKTKYQLKNISIYIHISLYSVQCLLLFFIDILCYYTIKQYLSTLMFILWVFLSLMSLILITIQYNLRLFKYILYNMAINNNRRRITSIIEENGEDVVAVVAIHSPNLKPKNHRFHQKQKIVNENDTVFGLAVIDDEKNVTDDRFEANARSITNVTNDSNIEILNRANLQPFPTVMHPQNDRWDTSSYSRSSSNSISITNTTTATVNTVTTTATHNIITVDQLSNDLSNERKLNERQKRKKKKQKPKKYLNEKRNEIMVKLSSDQKTFLNAMMRHSLLMLMLLSMLILLLLIYCGWVPFLLIYDDIWLMVNEVLVLLCTVIIVCMMYFTFEINVGEYEKCCSMCDVMLFDCCEGIPQSNQCEKQQYYVH